MLQRYGEDVAYIHDQGFLDFARHAAPGLLKIFSQCGVLEGRVVDLGCGSGLWAAELVRAGYDVLGIDQSAAMIAMSRKRAPQGTFRRGSFLTVKLPRCDAVTALGEVFNYLFDGNVGMRTLSCVFSRVYDALRPGGAFVFDVAGPGRLGGKAPFHRHWEGDDWAILADANENAARRELTRRMTSFRKVGRHYRRSEEVHRLRLYKASELARELRRVGFRVRILRGYGELRFKPGWSGFVARKP